MAIQPLAAPADARASKSDVRQERLAAEHALDEILAASFPASDPPSWNPGIARPGPAAHLADEGRPDEAVAARPGVIDISRPAVDRTFMQAAVSIAGAGGLALLVPLGILLIGVPLALSARGLIEAAGWLFAAVSP